MNKYVVAAVVGTFGVVALVNQSVLGRLLEFILDIAAPVVTMFAMWAVHRLIKVFETRTKVDVPQKFEDMIDEWVKKGVYLAEEKSRTLVKSKGPALAGPEKLELAAGFVLDLAESYGLKDLAKDKVEKLIESKLLEERLDPKNTLINV